MAINVTKFMVTVETKNYPVVTIRPTIQRYARIRKKMNASEITTTTSSKKKSSKKATVVEQPVEETPDVTEPTGEQNEEFIQEDPEDEDKFSDAPYYEGDDE